MNQIEITLTWQLKCELPKLIIRQNIGSILAQSRQPTAGYYYWASIDFLHRSSAGPTTAAFVYRLNLPTYSRNLARCRPYTKPMVTFTMASSSESRRARVWPMDGTLLGHVSLLPRQTIFTNDGPVLGRI